MPLDISHSIVWVRELQSRPRQSTQSAFFIYLVNISFLEVNVLEELPPRPGYLIWKYNFSVKIFDNTVGGVLVLLGLLVTTYSMIGGVDLNAKIK